MTEHELKTWPVYFQAVLDGRKPFEVRRNDRGFQAGDILLLREHDPMRSYMEAGRYTGRQLRVQVTYLLFGAALGIVDGYCVMGIRPVNTEFVIGSVLGLDSSGHILKVDRPEEGVHG